VIGLEHRQALRPNRVAYLDPQCRVAVVVRVLQTSPQHVPGSPDPVAGGMVWMPSRVWI
jgi:hypothetical protein